MTASPPPADPGRRRLLRALLESPLWLPAVSAGLGWPVVALGRPELAVPDTAARALDVFQLRAAAQRALDLPTWHFVTNGADDGKTKAANRQAFDAWQIRARRLVDVSAIDTSVELLGESLPSPILLAPVGNQQALHGDGELASARAAGRRGHLMICSTVTSYSISEIAAVAGAPLWFQLYASSDPDLMRKLIADAETAGCRVLVLTVDSPTRGNREGERWFAKQGGRDMSRMGNFENYPGPPRIGDASLTWDIVDWLRRNSAMRIVLKGIVTREDARLAARARVDGVIVSNHGGRQEESGRGTLECLPEVLDGADGRYPVMIDGGFRRGTDIFKALALGARAVCVGRPYLWGLGAFGEAGVQQALTILHTELRRIMQLAGTPDLAAITPAHIMRTPARPAGVSPGSD